MKEKFSRIVLPVDGSDASMRAAKRALKLAEETKNTVLAIYVIESPVAITPQPPDQMYTLWTNALKQEAEKTLDKVKEMGEKRGVNMEAKIVEGTADKEIISEADENDLIIMGSQGKSALDRILLGSVSEKVLHHASSPVMIVR